LKELAAYEVPEGELPLNERPQLIALNKIDVPEGRELAEFVKPELEARGYSVFLISAVSHEGTRELNFALAELVNAHRAAKAAIPPKPRINLLHARKDDNKFIVRKEESSGEEFFRVLGTKPERWVAQTMFGNEEAVGYLGDRFAKLGLEDELLKAGAVAGSTVVIGPGDGIIFDWEPTISSAGELIAAPRGTDPRLDLNDRRTNIQRRREYQEMMDSRAKMREEMAKEGNPAPVTYEIGSTEDPDAKAEGQEDDK
jgi:GTP-binding protein